MCKPSHAYTHPTTPYRLSLHATEQLVRQELQWFGASPHSDVFRGRVDQHFVSVKRLRSYNNSENDRRMQLGYALRWWKEVASHPNIQPFLGLLDNPHGSLPMLVTAYIDWSLMEYLRIRPETDKYILAYCIASALEYMHHQNPPVLHGNLKASNVLVKQNGSVYLSDIGICEMMYNKGQTGYAMRWRAPERVLQDQPHTRACDVWSFGMTILEIYTGVHPFEYLPHDANVVLAMGQEETPRRPENNAAPDDGFWALLLQSWNYTPSLRSTMPTILSWIRLLKETSRVAKLPGVSSAGFD